MSRPKHICRKYDSIDHGDRYRRSVIGYRTHPHSSAAAKAINPKYPTDPLPSKEESPKVASTELVRPGDITNAVDSRDLLDRLMMTNIERITKKVDKRVIDEWLTKRKKELRDQYIARAKPAYQKMWKVCESKKVGHNYRNLDVRGYTIKQCDDCKFACPSSTHSVNDSFDFARQQRVSNEMNEDQIKALAERMIEVDIEAGIFTWPTAEDYPNIVIGDTGTKKKKWIFG